LGIAGTVFVLVALLAACTVSLRAAWTRRGPVVQLAGGHRPVDGLGNAVNVLVV
jgi:hypothetical protein